MTPIYTADRLDDLPLLVGLLRQLRLDAILETHLGKHGNTRRQMDVDNGAPTDDGLMRFGFTKSGTPSGRAQVKLMGATTAHGQLMACTVAPGNTSDSPLYLLLVQRVRHQVGAGRLYRRRQQQDVALGYSRRPGGKRG